MRVPIALAVGVAAVLATLIAQWQAVVALITGAVVTAVTQVLVEVWKRRKAQLVDNVNRVVDRVVSQFPRKYRDYVASTLRYIDQKGLATIGEANPDLDDVYVDVSMAPMAPHQADAGMLPGGLKDPMERRDLAHFLDEQMPAVLAVVGVPGSGKTTLLRHTARFICQQPKGRRRSVPILLYLRDHVDAIAEDKTILLPELVRESIGRLAASEPTGWFGDQLANGRCVVLLDGLDEVAGQGNRRLVAAWVERQARQYPDNDFVITSRREGILDAPIHGSQMLQTRRFTQAQVRRFVNRWYLAMERMSSKPGDDQVPQRAKAAANDLLGRLDSAPGLADFTANPLLLTMIANVHKYRGALPGSRTNLYSEICQVMLWRRQEAKNLPIGLSGDKKEQMLRALAYRMMTAGVGELKRADVLDEFAPTLRKLSTPLTAADILADVSSNGLLIEREEGLYAFAHKTFQEYLAARYINENAKGDELIYRVDDAYWEETILLYTTMAAADDIIRGCLASGTANALSLALKCLEQRDVLELEPDVRDELASLLTIERFDQATAHQRRTTATILAHRYTMSWAHPRRGVRIAERPVPADIYRIFELEQGRAREGEATGACGGMSGVRAEQFCRWFNDLLDSDQAYRLPRRTELDNHTGSDIDSRLVWVKDEAIGVWARHGKPHLVTRAALFNALRHDLQHLPTVFLLLVLHAYRTAHAPSDFPEQDQKAPRAAPTEVSGTLRAALRMARSAGDDEVLVPLIGRLERIALVSEERRQSQWYQDLAEITEEIFAEVPEADPLLSASSLAEAHIGRPFAAAVLKISGEPTSAPVRKFIEALADRSELSAWDEWDAPPEALPALLRAVLARLAKLFTRPDAWPYRAMDLLGSLLPLADAENPVIDPGDARLARLVCFGLSALTRSDNDDLALRLLDVAAGFTLLESRTDRTADSDETIVLVADWSKITHPRTGP
ncbi:NACHT domain-containing protein [Actinokineospora terrae]|uniref:NACHT domain-containing protein n=1 Tax=Actinokineospora terrae TaxID=155974 RepID=A0A1H9NSG3_9PSEU|nr:NACHT domain-containing protein [Actinokineospora terrae]SER38273.1 NACHT domain-containing protein [Actinokineospora terrae]